MADYERQTAKKCRIGHLVEGNYVQKEGWDPSYVETSVGKVSRANIMAVVVSKDPDSLTLDDGSGKMELRSFGEVPLERFDVGDKVLVICRPRLYNDNMYLAAEAARKIENEKWMEYRSVEIDLLPKVTVEKKGAQASGSSGGKAEVQTETMTEEKQEETGKQLQVGEKIIEKIKDLDSGNGADVDEVIEGLEKGERVLNRLMEEGEIFEIRPGKVKVLE